MVVDNASSDGTVAMLHEAHPDVQVLALPTNQGGAGGFHAGLAHAYAGRFDWIWLMDDDTIPTATCLEALLEAARRLPAPPALLASKVVWTDGRLHPMNHPGLERERADAVVRASELGLMPLRTATFVSLLVSHAAVHAFGLPLRRYFLWSDDIEYTARILRRAPGYLVPSSVVVHKTEQPHTAVSTSGDRFYFHLRNTLYMLRGNSWAPSEKPSVLYFLISTVITYLRANRFAPRVLMIVLRGPARRAEARSADGRPAVMRAARADGRAEHRGRAGTPPTASRSESMRRWRASGPVRASAATPTGVGGDPETATLAVTRYPVLSQLRSIRADHSCMSSPPGRSERGKPQRAIASRGDQNRAMRHGPHLDHMSLGGIHRVGLLKHLVARQVVGMEFSTRIHDLAGEQARGWRSGAGAGLQHRFERPPIGGRTTVEQPHPLAPCGLRRPHRARKRHVRDQRPRASGLVGDRGCHPGRISVDDCANVCLFHAVKR